MSDALEIHHLSHRYGRVHALDRMTWSARTGRVTAVLGPNGAGKSTCLAICQGLIKPHAGSVQVLGTQPWNASAEHRARVGVMLQDGGLPNLVSPRRLLTHLSRFYQSPASYGDLMEALDLTAVENRIVRRLSGGQRQRVALAAALMGQPELVFLDEPTASLDPHVRLAVWDLISSLTRRGCSVILATHHFDEAERVADDVVIVHQGRVAAHGTTSDVAGENGLEHRYFALTARTPKAQP